MTSRLLFYLMALFTIDLPAQDVGLSFQRHHPDTLKAWTNEIMSELAKKHPGFYRYTNKQSFDNAIDSTIQSMRDSLSTVAYYRVLKPLFARIGCLHTSVTLFPDAMAAFEKEPSLFPLEFFVDSANHAFISGNLSGNPEIPLKGEVLAINGKPMGQILSTLLAAIPSDGYNRSLKLLVLNHRFAFWYQTLIDNPRTFQVDVRFEGIIRSFNVDGITAGKFPTMDDLESANSKQLVLSINEGVGYLTIHSFANSVIQKNGQRFKRFVRGTVKTLNEEKIDNLVIDLRYNTGGTDGNAAFLARNLFNKPFRYWDRIEVTEAVAFEIKGFKRFFYPKPRKKDSHYQWKKVWWTNEFDFFEEQHPVRKPYRGKVYILTNGLSMSSCADVTAILSANGRAIIVGQETGGGYQGNNSGLIPTANIPGNLRMSVPLLKYVNAVDERVNHGRGTIPTHIVTPTLDDWINRKDIEMEVVRKLIAIERSKPE